MDKRRKINDALFEWNFCSAGLPQSNKFSNIYGLPISETHENGHFDDSNNPIQQYSNSSASLDTYDNAETNTFDVDSTCHSQHVCGKSMYKISA